MNLFLLQFRQLQRSRPKNAPLRGVNFLGNLQSLFHRIPKDLLAQINDVINGVVVIVQQDDVVGRQPLRL